jgi:phosphoserine aminotransferase
MPANYKVLFMQGGAIAENAIVPMNMLRGHASADYIDTGEWSKKSIKEARKYGTVNVAASAADSGYTTIPPRDTWKLDPEAAYVHICSNETIGGVEYHFTPDVGQRAAGGRHVQLHPVAAGGCREVRADLRRRAEEHRPGRLDHRHRARRPAWPAPCRPRPAPSTTRPWPTTRACTTRRPPMRSTSPGWCSTGSRRRAAWWRWKRTTARKAALLYDYLDTTAFYSAPVAKDCRSLMNVPFKLKDEALDGAFLKGAEARGMVQLKGHRSVGGMRASIYNAMPIEGVQALVAYMKEFEAQHG